MLQKAKITIENKTSKPANSMEELLKYSSFSLPKPFLPGQTVEGIVVLMGGKEVMVDVGAKSEGVISDSELEDEFGTSKTLKVGDKVLATVVKTEDKRGYLVLSLKRAAKEQRWRTLFDNFTNKTPIEVKVIEYNKGGILVDVTGLRGFVPISHLSKAHFMQFNKASADGGLTDINKKLPQILSEMLKVRIIEIERSQNRIVLSEKILESAKLEKAVKEKLAKLKVEDILVCNIIAVLPFGLLADCGGVDGLIHISEISWEKITNIDGDFKVGDSVKVKIISIDEKEGKLGLSIKRLKDNPWGSTSKKYVVGTLIKGKVSKIMPFGAFVEIEPGIEGLIHVSETVGPLNVGEDVKAMIVSFDPQNQKLALSIRKIEEAKIYK